MYIFRRSTTFLYKVPLLFNGLFDPITIHPMQKPLRNSGGVGDGFVCIC